MNMWGKALFVALLLGCLLLGGDGQRGHRGRGSRRHGSWLENHRPGHWNVCNNRRHRFEQCCWNGEIYDTRNSSCCLFTTGRGGEVRAKPEGACRAGCCGSTTYNRDTQLCCNHTVQDKLPSVCNPGCCGDSVYDRDGPQICCSRTTLVDIPSNTIYPRCCGITVYDGTTHRCCNGHLIDREAHCHG